MSKTKIRPTREIKSAGIKSAGEAQQADLDLINQYARTPLTADQVYTFKLQLCDNEVDRQFDHFTPQALNELSALFVGKTVIADHDWKTKKQRARIYSTMVETVQGKQTQTGEPYMRLVAMAYMLRIDANADIISEIEGGILKEGSVAFDNETSTCDLCGCDYYSHDCPHWKGNTYTENGVEKVCTVTLDDVTDAYEFSLVAVPAQRAAGVTKAFKDGRTLSSDTVKRLSAARALRDKAMDCVMQARAIEDELVGEWPDLENPDESENPTGAPLDGADDDPDGGAEIPPCAEEPDDVKGLRARISLILGGK